MHNRKIVPSAIVRQNEGIIKAIGLDFWNTVAEIVRENHFWAKAAVEGVLEPLILLKPELGLADPTMNLDQVHINTLLVLFWCTTHVDGDEKDYLENLAETLKSFGIECRVTPAAVKKLKEIVAQERKDFRVFPDVPDALKALKDRGLTLALLPNQSQFNSDKYLSGNTFKKYVDKVFWSYKVGLLKPDVHYFETVLKDLGIKPEEFLFVDDQPLNLLAAKSMGIKVVRIEREGKILQQPLHPAMAGIPVIRTLSELTDGKRRFL